MSSLVDSMKEGVNSILGIRETLGADLRRVYFVTRTWTGGKTAGEGTATEELEELIPRPGIKNLAHIKKISKEGGANAQGDLVVHGISKANYEDEARLRGDSGDRKVEWFYKVGDYYYEIVSVAEKHLTWEVTLRRKTDQRGV